MKTTQTLRSINASLFVGGALAMLATPAFALQFMPLRHQSAATAAAVSKTASAKPTTTAPRGGTPLTGQQVFEIFVGETWRWGEGGGYFGPHGAFRGRSYYEGGVSQGAGTWGVNDNGRMCFRAVWTTNDGSSRANTCFDHVALGGDIYQRKAPDGDWYVFRHAAPAQYDEYNKLVRGNPLGLQ